MPTQISLTALRAMSLRDATIFLYRWRMFRYLSSGAVCAVIEYFLLVALYGSLGWNVHLANLSALTGASLLNYLLSRYWIFGKSDREIHFEFMLFLGVTISSFALNHLIFLGLHKAVGWDYRLAKVLTIFLVIAFNYSAKRMVVFRNGRLDA